MTKFIYNAIIMKVTTFLKSRSNWELHRLIYQCRQNLDKSTDNEKHYYQALILKYENELIERLNNKQSQH